MKGRDTKASIWAQKEQTDAPIREREDRDFEQVDRQQGRRAVGLAAHRPERGAKAEGQFRQRPRPGAAAREGLDEAEQHAEHECGKQRGDDVEFLLGAVAVRQGFDAENIGDHAERDIDREQPVPGGDGEHEAGEAGAERGRNADGERVEAHRLAELGGGKNIADEGGIDAHDAGGADALEDARGGEKIERPRAGAAERGDGEHDHAGAVDAAVTVNVAERGERQQQDDDGELIDADNGDRLRRGGVEVARDGRQRHIGNRGVHDGQGERDDDRAISPIAAGNGHAVPLDCLLRQTHTHHLCEERLLFVNKK